MQEVQCVLCGKKQHLQELYPASFSLENITAKIFSARRTPDRMHYRFVTCIQCGLIFSNPILSAEKIADLYTKSTYEYDREEAFLKKTYGQYFEKLLHNKKREPLHFLDIGCGNGFFLEEAKKRGVGHVFGIEPGSSSVKKAKLSLRKYITVGLFKRGVYQANAFDVVCCFQTLDHIIDPNSFLQEIFRVLKKGGRALFIVHDTDGLSVKLLGEQSPIFDIEHIYLFNKATLTALFRKNKFTVLQTFIVKNTYPLSYWIRMVPLPALYKSWMLAFLQKTYLGKVPLQLAAGNIGIIVQK